MKLIKVFMVGKYIRRYILFLLIFINIFFTQYSDGLPFTEQNLTYKHFLSDEVSEKSFKRLLEFTDTNNIFLNKMGYENFFKECKEVEGFYAFSNDKEIICTQKIWNTKYTNYVNFYGKKNIDKLKNKNFYVIYLDRIEQNKKSILFVSYTYELFLNELKKIIFYSRVRIISLKRQYAKNIINKLIIQVVGLLKYISNLTITKDEIYSKLYTKKYFPKYDSVESISFVNNNNFSDDKIDSNYRFAVFTLLKNRGISLQLIINFKTNEYFFLIKEVKNDGAK